MSWSPRLVVPVARVNRFCHHLGRTYSCNRPQGHTGRHSYVWRCAGPMSGNVRAVWT